MTGGGAMPPEGGRLKAYHVYERLEGTAEYLIFATSAAEAREKLRAGEHDGMQSSPIDHTGRCRIRRAPDEDYLAEEADRVS